MRFLFLAPLIAACVCACSDSSDDLGGATAGPCAQCTRMKLRCGWDDGETDYCMDQCNQRQARYTPECQHEYDEALTCFNDGSNWTCDEGLTGCQEELSEFEVCAMMPCEPDHPACEVCNTLRDTCDWDYQARCNCLSACGNDLMLEGDCQQPLDDLAACVSDASRWTCDGSPPPACAEERDRYRQCTVGQPGWECDAMRESVGTWVAIPELPTWTNAFASDGNGRLYAATGEPGGANSGVFVSQDHGETWTPVSGSLPSGSVDSIAHQAGTLYAVVDMLVYASSDGGASWTQAGPDMLFGSEPKIVADPFVVGRLYGLTMEGPMRSDDAGKSWSPITQGLPTHMSGLVMVSALIAAPEVEGRLYALPDDYGVEGYGVYRSENSGAAWVSASVGMEGSAVEDLIGGPAGQLWATTWEYELYRSQDAAQSWAKITPHHPCVHDFAHPTGMAVGQQTFLLVDTGDLLESGDGGLSWTLIAKHTKSYGLGWLFADPAGNVVIAVGDEGVFRVGL